MHYRLQGTMNITTFEKFYEIVNLRKQESATKLGCHI